MTVLSKKFKRKTENFICEKCDFVVTGNGYTNHCPKCLWSKHVDIHPGDRAANCEGLMKPIKIEMKSGNYIIVHECQRCGHNKRNKINKEDDFDVVIKITTQVK
jgi:Zn ribbon nucleic-acid-binding protein